MSDPVEMVLAALQEHGIRPAAQVGGGYSCVCPSHEDRTPSLSIGVGDDGRALIHCHAGCTLADICQSIGLRPGDLFDDDRPTTNGHAPRPRPRPRTPAIKSGSGEGPTFGTAREALAELERRHGPRSATWTYTNAAGDPCGLVVRWDLPDGKLIRPVSKSPNGWVCGGMPTPRPLYQLRDLLASKPGDRVYIVEGEKSVDAVRACGLLATTSAHGSKSARKTDWTPLAGRDVVILPDHDEPGEKYADAVFTLATDAGAKSVRVVRLADELPDATAGFDAADLLAMRGGDVLGVREAIEALVSKTTPTNADTAKSIDGAPMIVRLSDVKPEPVDWLWPGRIALGKLTLLAGDPGLGKSFLSLDIAARVSRGGVWPDAPGVGIEPGGVVLLSAEDGMADTIRPRLDAAGADVSRIFALEAIRTVGGNGRESTRSFDLSRDLQSLEETIRLVVDCRLVVIDPISAYLGGTDSHKNADIRGLLAPLSAIAERHRVAVVAVTHLNKSGGGPAIYRAMGSLAFAAAARAAWAVAKDQDDPQRRLLLPIKNNIGADTGGLAYRIESTGHGDCPVVAWEPDAINVRADDALAAERPGQADRTERDDAADWLHEYLENGPKLATDVFAESKAAGFAKRTIERAKSVVGALANKRAFGGAWEWALPAKSQGRQPDTPKAATPETVAVFADGGGLRVFDPDRGGTEGGESSMFTEGRQPARVADLGDTERLDESLADGSPVPAGPDRGPDDGEWGEI